MKTKSILFIVLTLLIGFVLGFLTSSQIRNQKLKPVRFFFSSERFREGMYNIIQPTDAQKEEIDRILDKYEKLNFELQSDFRKQFDSNMKSFRKEVDSKLTREQLARMKEMDEKRQEMIRKARQNRDNDTLDRNNDRRYDRFRQGPPPPHYGDRDTSRHDTTGH